MTIKVPSNNPPGHPRIYGDSYVARHTLSLDPKVVERLDLYASHQGKSRSYMANLLIREALAKRLP